MKDRSYKLYREWMEDSRYDEDTKKELQTIAGCEEEIRDRFYKDLEFGTGGLRGVIGAGTNRMNIYTVRKATQGLANYILKENGAEKGAVIAFDSRRMSPEFSMETALVLCANGIRTYRFTSLRPTPELSFALRYLGCKAGIVITASHNPREYNGYKVYWEDGAQITPPHDRNILTEVGQVSDLNMVKTIPEIEAREKGLLMDIGEEIDDAYIEAVKSLSIHPEIVREQAESLKIVYTPLHGTGNLPVRRILKELGFAYVSVVPEQEKPEGGVTIWIEDYDVESFGGADYEWCYSFDPANTRKLTDILSRSNRGSLKQMIEAEFGIHLDKKSAKLWLDENGVEYEFFSWVHYN